MSPPATEADLDELVRGGAEFACDLFSRLEKETNLLVSPTSIRLAFALVYAGARGATAEEMEEVLRYPVGGAAHDAFNALDLALAERNRPEGDEGEDPVELYLANAFWGQHGIPFRDEYLDLLAVNYGAGVEWLDFDGAPEDAREVINNWAEEETRERIHDLLPAGSIDPTVAAVLTNAVYFKAPWALPFDTSATADAPFHRIGGDEVLVPMMSRVDTFGYAEGEAYRALEMNYRGDELSMVVLLPDEGAFGSFESGLTGDLLLGIVEALEPTPVDAALPRFRFDSAFELRDTLKAMGMELTFTMPDLSGMVEAADLVVDEVFHKTFIALDEKGTEAAAATAIVIRENGVTPVASFVADRPFLFLIRDRVTGEVLFLGRVADPSS
jgi:serpin B